VLVRGRRLDPRRIVRYLFQELIAPWIHLKRFWLRVYWFFTTPLRIGPMWTTSVVAGLLGVMLTIMLFKPPGRLQASVQQPSLQPPPNFLATQFIPDQQEPPPTTSIPWNDFLVGQFNRTRLAEHWDQVQQATLVSSSSPFSTHNIPQPILDRWTMARRTLTNALPAVYRQTAPLWNPMAVAAAVVPQDRPASYGGAGESHPSLVVTRDLPAEASPSEPITYALTIQNRGTEILEQIVVSEQLSNLDHVEETHPPAEVSASALHWRIDSLRPREERRLAITLQPGFDRELFARGEVRTAVAVSSSTHVKAPAATPLTRNETPPALLETPRLVAPVEPASREEAPRFPKLSVIAEIPTSLKVDDELSTVFVVSNTGNGDADDVVLTVQVPAGLEHRDGALVEHRYARIPAGTTKRAVFKALARSASPGRLDAVLTLHGLRVADWAADVQIAAKPAATPSTINLPGNRPPLNASSIPGAAAQPANGSGASDSSIPSNRTLQPRPNPATFPPAAAPPGNGPAPSTMPPSTMPKSSIPGAMSPAPPEQQPPPAEDSNFVSIPRRAGAGGVSGWKRAMNR
jgi:hypothetical protein